MPPCSCTFEKHAPETCLCRLSGFGSTGRSFKALLSNLSVSKVAIPRSLREMGTTAHLNTSMTSDLARSADRQQCESDALCSPQATNLENRLNIRFLVSFSLQHNEHVHVCFFFNQTDCLCDAAFHKTISCFVLQPLPKGKPLCWRCG